MKGEMGEGESRGGRQRQAKRDFRVTVGLDHGTGAGDAREAALRDNGLSCSLRQGRLSLEALSHHRPADD